MNKQIAELLKSREPGGLVVNALMRFLDLDHYLLTVDANERSIAFRVAMYLQVQLPDMHVDCEFNRDGIDPKRIQHIYLDPTAEDTNAKTVFPDIVVHVRGTSKNYLVIEIKKTTNTVDREIDFAKLRGYKRYLKYDFALFIELIATDQPGVARVEWVDE